MISTVLTTDCWPFTDEMTSEVEGELDLSILRYSRVEEDHRVLTQALRIKPDHDVVLSITRYLAISS